MTPKPIRNRHLFVADFLSVIAATLIAFLVRFEQPQWISENLRLVTFYLALSVPLRLFIFFIAGMYRRLWRHASVGELRPILLAALGGGVACGLIGLIVLPATGLTPARVPFSVIFIDTFLTGALISLPRLMARINRAGYTHRRKDDGGKRVLIAGAGDAGKLVVKELFATSQLGLEPIGFVDSDATKHGRILAGLPVFGPLAHIPEIVERLGVAEIIIAMPSAPGTVIRQVVRAALSCGIPTRTVPSLPEIISRQGNATGLREVEIQDLLRRDAVETDLAAVAELATSETVLITGAGGSIGSELCRQLARLAPSRLILLGHGENSIFDIFQELTLSFPDVEMIPVIADVRDRGRIQYIFQQYRPHAVFHTAAHKHVPLMEDNVLEAVTNNVAGTRNVVDAAIEVNVQHFVLISTDKAVRPTSVMGATKRIAEQLVQHAATKHHRNFVSVRFGNVLGSRGSVVPTFLRQIRAGGPVTVTHPEMRRYFMTIPEAVQLVLQAGALGRGGEVFVLDMGEQIRIVDIATDLIRLSGLEVGADIEITFTGVRPGEKLYEEMFFTAENVLPTDHPKVLRARNGLLAEGTVKHIDALMRSTDSGRPEDEIRKLLQTLVPDFHPHGATSHEGEAPARGSETVRRA
ncbi:MAG: nucleoside-diphosphate sugar epimerase/dehydratase [Gemmatimonadaceae bacterium]|nr:nucleoside-diphosphate sugar epimerase/dehydratase [Gemmatimonadaceae bacterium]